LTEYIGANSTLFKMESWCAFPENLDNISGFFQVDFIHFADSLILSEKALDQIFFEEKKELEHPNIITADDSISYITNVSFKTSHELPTSTLFLDCDTLRHFEITNFEKVYSNDGQELRQVVIDANFDITMCGENGDTTKFENGNLRFFYILY